MAGRSCSAFQPSGLTTTVTTLLRRPGGRLGREVQALADHLGAGDRHLAEVLGHQAADGVDVLVVDLDVEELAQLVDGEPRD